MCAAYFAKCEIKVDADVAKVDTIEGEWQKFSSTFVNPRKELDALIFSMRTKINENEITRET